MTTDASQITGEITGLFATEFTEQAQVTNWPARIALVVAMFVIIVAVLWAMLRGWRSRQRRQSDIPAPVTWPGASQSSGTAGLYVGTSIAGDWLDRVAVHELGVRGRAVVALGPDGIGFARPGASPFFIPKADILRVRTDRGVAGTVRAKDSVIVITWRLGSYELDTGFRADDSDEHRTLLDGLMAALPGSGIEDTSQGTPEGRTYGHA